LLLIAQPDITFFGEKLPRVLLEQIKMDMPDLRKADLVIIMGTSLAVQPFASFVDKCSRATPRVFVNREGAGRKGDYDDDGGVHMGGRFGNFRDVVLMGESDKLVEELARKLGWKEELDRSIKEFRMKGNLLGVNSPPQAKEVAVGSSRSSRSSRRVSLNGGAACIHLK